MIMQNQELNLFHFILTENFCGSYWQAAIQSSRTPRFWRRCVTWSWSGYQCCTPPTQTKASCFRPCSLMVRFKEQIQGNLLAQPCTGISCSVFKTQLRISKRDIKTYMYVTQSIVESIRSKIDSYPVWVLILFSLF